MVQQQGAEKPALPTRHGLLLLCVAALGNVKCIVMGGEEGGHFRLGKQQEGRHPREGLRTGV